MKQASKSPRSIARLTQFVLFDVLIPAVFFWGLMVSCGGTSTQLYATKKGSALITDFEGIGTASWSVGDAVDSADFPPGTTVKAIDDGNITLSNPAIRDNDSSFIKNNSLVDDNDGSQAATAQNNSTDINSESASTTNGAQSQGQNQVVNQVQNQVVNQVVNKPLPPPPVTKPIVVNNPLPAPVTPAASPVVAPAVDTGFGAPLTVKCSNQYVFTFDHNDGTATGKIDISSPTLPALNATGYPLGATGVPVLVPFGNHTVTVKFNTGNPTHPNYIDGKLNVTPLGGGTVLGGGAQTFKVVPGGAGAVLNVQGVP